MKGLDFKGLAELLWARHREVLSEWYQLGKWINGEFCIGSVNGEKGQSLRINPKKEVWKDFASDEGGNDLISLYAAKFRISQSEAAKELADQYHHELKPKSPVRDHTPPKPKIVTEKIDNPYGLKPAPKDVPTPDGYHKAFGQPSLLHLYMDESGEHPVYITARYDPPFEHKPQIDKKQFIPWSWSTTQNIWMSRALPENRPLYNLDTIQKHDNILIVEGEKAADYFAAKFKHPKYAVTTWSGGSKAYRLTDWSPLEGKNILLWPDADKAGRDAMDSIAEKLDELGVEGIKVIDTEDLSDGFDAADITDEFEDAAGWVAWCRDRVKAWEKPEPLPEVVNEPTPLTPFSEEELDLIEAQERADEIDLMSPNVDPSRVLMTAGITPPLADKSVLGNLHNVLCIMENWRPLAKAVWLDTFHQKIFTNYDCKEPREWGEYDTINLTAWFQANAKMRRVTDQTVGKALVAYARKNTKNEVREWMESLKWDGTSRMDTFFEKYFGVEMSAYTEAVSKNFWLSMVARIYDPGCKVDNMVILEGKQGKGKSTALKTIAGKWFSVAEGDLNKDFKLGLQGSLIVEIEELDSFGRADAKRIKSFVSQPTDRLRVPYGRVVEEFPRQCVFVGTTNESKYLKDSTGGRRFWPLYCNHIEHDLLKEDREQLFAEAVSRYHAQEGHWEVPLDEAQKIQFAKTQSDPWTFKIASWVMGKMSVRVHEVATDCLKLEMREFDGFKQSRIETALKTAGFVEKNDKLSEDGRPLDPYWVRSDSLL